MDFLKIRNYYFFILEKRMWIHFFKGVFMISHMQKMLEKLQVDYADLRYETISTVELSQSKKGLSRALQNQSHGFVLRVVHQGGVGNALFSTEKDFSWACEQALHQAKLNARLRKTPCIFASVPVIQDSIPLLCEKEILCE